MTTNTDYPIPFGIKEDTPYTTLGNWSKHHEFIGIHVQREFPDKEKDDTFITSADLLEQLENNPSLLVKMKRNVYLRDTSSMATVVDSFLQLKNPTVAKPIRTFSTKAGNTRTEVGMRFHFLFEDSRFIFDKILTFRGEMAISHILSDITDLLDDQVFSEENDINESGIRYSDGMYTVAVVNQISGDFTYIDLERNDLVAGFVGFDIYKEETTIVKD